VTGSVGSISGVTFPTGFSSLTTATIASAVMGSTVAGVTLTNAIRYIGAAVSGLSSGSGTGTETYEDFAAATAFVVTIDSNGNRTGVTLS
jgi:hypothetical protein